MKGTPFTRAFAGTVVVALVCCLGTSGAQDIPVPKLNPSACQRIQEQVNEVVKVSQSPDFTNEQKVAQLSKSWAQSISAMQDKAKNDDEMTKLVNELGKAMGQVLALALVPSAKADKNVSADAQGAIDDVRKQVKPYVSFMKMLCPDLILPPEVSK
jgi:hypothetical protein